MGSKSNFQTRMTAAAATIGAILSMPCVLAQAPPAADSQEDYREFYLFDWLPDKTLEYEAPRQVQICNDYRRHDMPLRVRYDGKLATVSSGSCRSFKAKRIELSTAQPLEDGLSMSGSIKAGPICTEPSEAHAMNATLSSKSPAANSESAKPPRSAAKADGRDRTQGCAPLPDA
jgi:hypothetical protein